MVATFSSGKIGLNSGIFSPPGPRVLALAMLRMYTGRMDAATPRAGAQRKNRGNQRETGAATAPAARPAYEAALPWRCERCARREYTWLPRCAHCGARHALMYRPPGGEVPAYVEPAARHRRERPGPGVEPGRAAPRRYVYVPTGFAGLDAALNGGLARGTVTLFGAARKAGKTTLVLECFQRMRGDVAAYATAEQTEDQLMILAQRTGCTRAGLWIVETRELDDALDRFDALGARLVAIDSLQRYRVAGARGARGSDRMCRAVLERVQAWARARDAVAVLISHFTKGGDFAGESGTQHDVDVGLVITREGLDRTVTVEMTRIGPDAGPDGEPPRAYFRMDARGALRARPPPPPRRLHAAPRVVPFGPPKLK
jgi:hypothetical protein